MKKINKVQMGKAYVEMGRLNLQIANEFYHLEDEGEKLTYELATKNACDEGF